MKTELIVVVRCWQKTEPNDVRVYCYDTQAAAAKAIQYMAEVQGGYDSYEMTTHVPYSA